VAVPIDVEGHVIGVMNVESLVTDAFSQEDVLFLTTLAGLMSVSIARTRLYKQLANHSEELTLEVARQTVALAAERDRTMTILENAGESIFLLNGQGEIIYVNRAFEVRSGYKKEELMGRVPGFLLAAAPHRDELWQVLKSGRS
jgi:PAS domain-containing protein